MDDLEAMLDKGVGARFTQLSERLARHSRSYQCHCSSRIFFRNKHCLACQSPLGYLPYEGRLAALDPGTAQGTWCAKGCGTGLKFCANRDSPAACNWMTDAADSNVYCIACRLNRTIPNLDDADNVLY